MLRERVSELPNSGACPVAPADLAQGLSFLRASNLQVMRLQLAAERKDRRGVMAAIDELVGLDRELCRFIQSIPGAATPLTGTERPSDVMEQRLILSRGKSGPAFDGPRRPKAVEAEAPVEAAADIGEEGRGGVWARLLILLGLVCLAAVAILYGLTGSPIVWPEFSR